MQFLGFIYSQNFFCVHVSLELYKGFEIKRKKKTHEPPDWLKRASSSCHPLSIYYFELFYTEITFVHNVIVANILDNYAAPLFQGIAFNPNNRTRQTSPSRTASKIKIIKIFFRRIHIVYRLFPKLKRSYDLQRRRRQRRRIIRRHPTLARLSLLLWLLLTFGELC